MRRTLIASGEMPKIAKPLVAPCSDCPLRRDSAAGWLGGSTPEEYRQLLHSDHPVECHVHGHRCAGAAIYRNNVCKSQAEADALPKDKERVFATPMQFTDYHTS